MKILKVVAIGFAAGVAVYCAWRGRFSQRARKDNEDSQNGKTRKEEADEIAKEGDFEGHAQGDCNSQATGELDFSLLCSYDENELNNTEVVQGVQINAEEDFESGPAPDANVDVEGELGSFVNSSGLKRCAGDSVSACQGIALGNDAQGGRRESEYVETELVHESLSQAMKEVVAEPHCRAATMNADYRNVCLDIPSGVQDDTRQDGLSGDYVACGGDIALRRRPLSDKGKGDAVLERETHNSSNASVCDVFRETAQKEEERNLQTEITSSKSVSKNEADKEDLEGSLAHAAGGVECLEVPNAMPSSLAHQPQVHLNITETHERELPASSSSAIVQKRSVQDLSGENPSPSLEQPEDPLQVPEIRRRSENLQKGRRKKSRDRKRTGQGGRRRQVRSSLVIQDESMHEGSDLDLTWKGQALESWSQHSAVQDPLAERGASSGQEERFRGMSANEIIEKVKKEKEEADDSANVQNCGVKDAEDMEGHIQEQPVASLRDDANVSDGENGLARESMPRTENSVGPVGERPAGRRETKWGQKHYRPESHPNRFRLKPRRVASTQRTASAQAPAPVFFQNKQLYAEQDADRGTKIVFQNACSAFSDSVAPHSAQMLVQKASPAVVQPFLSAQGPATAQPSPTENPPVLVHPPAPAQSPIPVESARLRQSTDSQPRSETQQGSPMSVTSNAQSFAAAQGSSSAQVLFQCGSRVKNIVGSKRKRS